MGQTQSGEGNRIDEEFTKVNTEMDKSHLRNIRKEKYICSAKCCDDPYASPEKVDECIENCSKTYQKSYKYVQNELHNLENQISDCIMKCETSTPLGENPSKETIDQCTKEFLDCGGKCVEDHLAALPSMIEAMRKVLDSGKLPSVEE